MRGLSFTLFFLFILFFSCARDSDVAFHYKLDLISIIAIVLITGALFLGVIAVVFISFERIFRDGKR